MLSSNTNIPLGILTWIASGFASFAISRAVPAGRGRPAVDAVASLVVSVIFGLVATALDFGGRSEPDWRAALLVLAGTFAVLGLMRVMRILRQKKPEIV